MIKVEKSIWHNNTVSPVMFMIDDFGNAWVDSNNNGIVDAGEDWGYDCDGEKSSFTFLKNSLLSFYPNIKITFFTFVGKRAPQIIGTKYGHAGSLNENEKIANFFRQVASDERSEIAYHGLTHGQSGKRARNFKQEWESFSSFY